MLYRSHNLIGWLVCVKKCVELLLIPQVWADYHVSVHACGVRGCVHVCVSVCLHATVSVWVWFDEFEHHLVKVFF